MKFLQSNPSWKRDQTWKNSLKAYSFFFGALSLVVALKLDFQQLHNDFWDVYFVARHMTWADKQTWFNPQYPVGYCLFLKGIVGKRLPVPPAILANIFFGMSILFVSARFYRKFMPPGYALLSLLMLSSFPMMFHYLNVGGGDPGAVAFFSLGAALVLSALCDPNARGNRIFFASGVSLGLAALFRYHTLVADVMLILSLFDVFPRRWKSLLLVSVGVFLAYSPQLAVNLLTGHGLLKTQFGPMNIYYLMHGINWYHATDLYLPGFLTIIAGDPGLFLKKYLQSFLSYYPVYLPALFAAIFDRDSGRRKAALAIAVWILAYFIFFAAMDSERKVLLPLPLSLLTLGLSLRILMEKLNGVGSAFRRRIGFSLVTAGLTLVLARNAYWDLQMLKNLAFQRDAWKSIEVTLKSRGCTRSAEVFSSSYDLYFRTLSGFVPYFNGGAPRWGTYLYNREFPEFPVDSESEFIRACRNRNVRFVVLDSDSRQLSDLFGDLYEGKIEMAGLPLESETKGYRIYRVM